MSLNIEPGCIKVVDTFRGGNGQVDYAITRILARPTDSLQQVRSHVSILLLRSVCDQK